MSAQNAMAILEMYRHRNVAAVRTPSGIVFMGTKNLKPSEKKTLLSLSQSDLDAAIRWQK